MIIRSRVRSRYLIKTIDCKEEYIRVYKGKNSNKSNYKEYNECND